MIEQCKFTSTSPNAYQNCFKTKTIDFGSNATETKANKQLYIKTHKAFFILCQNELLSLENDEDDINDSKHVSSSRKIRRISSVLQTHTLILPPIPLLLLSLSPESTTTTNDCHNTHNNTQTVICDVSCEHDNNFNLAEQSDSALIFHLLQVIVLSMSCQTSLGCDMKRWGTAKVNFELWSMVESWDPEFYKNFFKLNFNANL